MSEVRRAKLERLYDETPEGEIPAVLCGHANECPSVCPCPPNCYCRRNGSAPSCRGSRVSTAVIKSWERDLQLLLDYLKDDLGLYLGEIGNPKYKPVAEAVVRLRRMVGR